MREPNLSLCFRYIWHIKHYNVRFYCLFSKMSYCIRHWALNQPYECHAESDKESHLRSVFTSTQDTLPRLISIIYLFSDLIIVGLSLILDRKYFTQVSDWVRRCTRSNLYKCPAESDIRPEVLYTSVGLKQPRETDYGNFTDWQATGLR
jgi:hypothetical protein